MSSTIQLTSDELVQALHRSQLPTIVVEGRDDMTIYRWLETCDCLKQVDVMPCGGRTVLLEVFRRRLEFNHIPCAFIADTDMWLFSKIPQDYKEIVFTRGYSIENDLLDGSSVADLFEDSERSEFDMLCNALAPWFAFEIEQYRRGECFCVDLHPNRLIPPGTTTLDRTALAPRTFQNPNKRLVRSIRENFHLRFRGKSLVSLYARILNDTNRASKYSRKNILEISAKCDSTSHTRRLFRLICHKINKHGK